MLDAAPSLSPILFPWIPEYNGYRSWRNDDLEVDEARLHNKARSLLCPVLVLGNESGSSRVFKDFTDTVICFG